MGKEQRWRACPYREPGKKCHFGRLYCIDDLPGERKERLALIEEIVQLCLQTYVIGRTLNGAGPLKLKQTETE